MKKIVAVICLITLLCMSTCVAFAEQMMVTAMGNHESDNNGYYVAKYGY